MSKGDDSPNFCRQIFAGVLGVAIIVAGVLICHQLIRSWGIWGVMGASLAPLVAGLATGLAIRFSRAEGTFGLASLAFVLILFFGLACSAMRHQILFDSRLEQFAGTACDETLAYSRHAVSVADNDVALWRFMTNNEVSVIGRLTPTEGSGYGRTYWEARNFVHLHWVASRQIVIYGQGGVDKTIWEASRVSKECVFLDNVVSAVIRYEAVTDRDMARFRQYELPFLKKMLAGEITRKDFTEPLIREVRSRAGWTTFAANGFDPFLGMSMLFGGLIAYWLIRRPSEAEII
jgi:hypothetical protein